MAELQIDIAEDVSLYVTYHGRGEEMVLFLHPVGGDHSFFSPQIEQLSRYLCVSLDMRGHNRSSAPAPFEQSVTIENFARDAILLIEHFGYFRAHLVGLSMGGVVALEVYRQRPDLVQSLLLANSWAYHPEGEARIEFIEGQLERMSMAESSALLIPRLFAPATPQKVIDHAIEVESSKQKEVFLASWRSMFRTDYREMLPKLSVPMLLVGGSCDSVTPTALLEDVFRAVPTSRLVEIEGAGHFSSADHPVEFLKHLSIHLSRARSNRSQRKHSEKAESISVDAENTAHALVAMLPYRGIDCFFSNSGTDFTPIIDALAKFDGRDWFKLRTIQTPHENTAIAMAHGHYLLSGRPQAVMAHVNVGTANMGLGLINASRSHIPMLVLAGRTPWYESDVEGCRTNFVQWGQDTFDQGAYFREFTRWDYELKGAHNLETILDRALAISNSSPAGPVYLQLPKEPLCEPISGFKFSATARQQPHVPQQASSEAAELAARMILDAERPLCITAELGRYRAGPEALVQLAKRFAIPVIEHGKRNFFNYPTEDSMHLGFAPSPYVEQADLIIAIETHVPWIPAVTRMKRPPRVIQIGVDPLCRQLPMRSFPVDLALAGDPALTLCQLRERLEALLQPSQLESINERSSMIANEHRSIFERARLLAGEDSERDVITKRYLSYCIGQAIDDDVVIFNEYNLDPELVPRRLPDSWFENSVASGLGWSLGAALGAQLACPHRTMMVTLGDGTYLFNTPLSAHYVAAAYQLPILIVVFNDSAWSTIKKSYKASHKDGWASRRHLFPLCDFDFTVSFEKLAEACGGIGIRLSEPKTLLEQIRSAINRVRSEKRHLLLNVICERDG